MTLKELCDLYLYYQHSKVLANNLSPKHHNDQIGSDGRMVLRWASAAFLETEKHFKRISGYKQLWMLKSYLDRSEQTEALAVQRKVG